MGLSTTDWVPGGWDVEQTIELAKILRRLGVDMIDCSSGGADVTRQQIPLGPGYQVPNAALVRAGADMPVAAVGLITTAEQAEAILAEGQADLIAIAREELRDPYFALHAAHTLGADIAWPDQYARARPG